MYIADKEQWNIIAVQIYVCNLALFVRVPFSVSMACVCVWGGGGAAGSRDGYPDAVNPFLFSAPCPHPLGEVW